MNIERMKSPPVILIISILMVFLLSSIAPTPAIAKEEGSDLKLMEELQNVFVDIAERVKPAVVNISPEAGLSHPPFKQNERRPDRPPEAPGSGSGVIVDKRGYIVTNNHVVGDADEVEVRLSDKSKFVGKVIGNDPDTDLAVVKIDSDKDLPFVPMGDSGKIKVGQWVIAVGNPFGLDRTVTVGVISALGRENVNLSRYEDFIQTDASINPGNSGGPLFNIKGEVIGINTAIINFAQGIGFAIPSSMVQQVMTQLINKGKVVRGWLGVGIQPVTEDLATKFGVKEGEGVLVNEVFETDPAAKAGIQPGDIITKVDGNGVDNPSTLSRMIASTLPGQKVEVEVYRDGKRKTIKVVLAERKEEATLASIPPSKQPEAMLGIDVQDLTPELAEKFHIKEDKGVLISKVDPGSTAETKGLREGDLIKEVNRGKVNNVDDFKKETSKIKKGDGVLLRVIRDNRAFFVVLETKEEQEGK
jgi:serine protease Do